MLNLIKQLRQESGCGIMDAQKALAEAKGDFAKAKKIIQKSGAMKAAKKAERKAGAGWIETYVHDGKIGVLLEMAAETDFVTKNEEFRNLAHELVLQIAAMNPKDEKELMKQEYIKDPNIKVGDLLTNAIAKIGENIIIKRFVRYEVGEEGGD